MRPMQNIKRVATIVLVSLGALAAHAANDNGKAYGQIKKEEKRAVSVPEPATFALLAAGLQCIGRARISPQAPQT